MIDKSNIKERSMLFSLGSNRKGAADWTVRKIVVLILLLLLLILLIVGLISGKLLPLGENIAAKVNTVLIMFGVMDDPGGFGNGDCTVPREVSILNDMKADFTICRSGLCKLDFGNNIECLYGMNSESMSCTEIAVQTKAQDKLFNHLFNDGLDELYILMGVDSYASGLDEYMGGTEYYDLSDRKIEYVLKPSFGEYISYTFQKNGWHILEKTLDSSDYVGVYFYDGEIDESNFGFGESGFEQSSYVIYGELESFLYQDGDVVVTDVDQFIKDVAYDSYGFSSNYDLMGPGDPNFVRSGGTTPENLRKEGVTDGKITNMWELESLRSAILFRLVNERKVIAPKQSNIETLRSEVEGKSVDIDGRSYAFGVEIGGGGFPVVTMTSSSDGFGLFYVGDRDPFSYYEGGNDFTLRPVPLRLVKWKAGTSGNVGWYSHGDVKSYKLPKDEFDNYYFINNMGSDNSLLNFFKEECR